MRPYSVVFNTTDECSLRCKYCFTNPNPRIATLQVAKDAIKYVVDNWKISRPDTPPSFAFFGGEPTLHWDDIMIPAVEWCRETLDKELKEFGVKVSFSMTTNGQHLTKERLEKWKSLHGGVLLSIDGIPYVQDNDRPRFDKGSSSKPLVEIIPTLLELFPNTTFRSTVTPFSVNYLFESFIYAYSLGFKSYFVCPNVREEWSEEAKATLAQHMEMIFNIQYCDISVGQDGLKFWNWFDQFKYALKKDLEIPFTTKRCGLGTTSCGIGASGEIFGCQEHNTYDETDIFYLGNIYTGGIEQDKIDALLARYSTLSSPKNVNNPDKCKTCPVKNCCNLLFCPSACLATTGALNILTDTDCFWKVLLFENAERILRLIKEDNNHAFLSFLMEKGYLRKEKCSCHAPPVPELLT